MKLYAAAYLTNALGTTAQAATGPNNVLVEHVSVQLNEERLSEKAKNSIDVQKWISNVEENNFLDLNLDLAPDGEFNWRNKVKYSSSRYDQYRGDYRYLLDVGSIGGY